MLKIPWRKYLMVTLILSGAVAFIVVGQMINRRRPAPPAPPSGWQTIRPPYEVSALVEQGEIIWAGGRDGVFALDRETGALIEQIEPGSRLLEYVRALLVDDSGALWVGHSAGLTRYDGSAWHTYTERDGLPDQRIDLLLEDQDGRIWVGTKKGAAVQDGQGWHILTSEDGLLHDSVSVMLQDQEGGMWFGSYAAPRGGLSYLQDGARQHFSTENGLPHNNVTALLEDGAGSVWVGTGLLDRGGACRLTRQDNGWVVSRVLTQQDGLAGAKVRSIFQDREGVLWFGSEYDGLARFDGETWRVFSQADGLAASEVKTMLQDEDGNLWLGTINGVTRITAAALAAMHVDLPSK